MTKARIAAAACCAALLGASSGARGQFIAPNSSTSAAENIQGFTVAGKGSITAKPNSVEIDVEVSASSEVSADAIVKYRDAKRRLQEAIASLKVADVTVEERGLLVDKKGMMNNPYFMGMQQAARTKSEVQLTRKLVVRAGNIRKLDEEGVLRLVAKLLDAAQDAGGQVGPRNDFNPYYYNPYNNQGNTGLVRFVLDDFDKLQEDAFESAIADARTRAQRLARLSHVGLGSIVAAREVVTPVDSRPTGDEEIPRKRLETSRFQDIPVRVELMVRFEVHEVPKAKAAP
jgi:uncharacterized protein